MRSISFQFRLLLKSYVVGDKYDAKWDYFLNARLDFFLFSIQEIPKNKFKYIENRQKIIMFP